jgi:hypothetical protein
MGNVLAIAGMSILLVGPLRLLSYPRMDKPLSLTATRTSGDHDNGSGRQDVDGERRLSQDFREQVSRAVFGHARRASYLNLVVAIAFFALGIGVFSFLAYGTYHEFFSPRSEQDGFVFKLAAYIAERAGSAKSRCRTRPQSLCTS